MNDEEVFELLINHKVKKLNYSWSVNRREFISATIRRLDKNKSIWKPDKFNLVFQLLLTLPSKVDELQPNIAEAMQYIEMNLKEFCLEDLVVFKLFSKSYYPSLYDTISDALTEHFSQFNDFKLLNFPEILTIANGVTLDFIKYSNNENFTQKFILFTNRISEITELSFDRELSSIVEISYIYHNIPLEYSESLQKVLACKISDCINAKQIKISIEKVNILLVLLKNINISSQMKQFIMKKILDLIGINLFKNLKKVYSVSEMHLYERLFVMATDLKIFYPSFMFSFFFNLKNKEHNAFGGKFGTEILVSFAFFNFLETFKILKNEKGFGIVLKQLEIYALADINSVQQMISNLKELTEPVKYMELKRAIKMAWYCSIFNFKTYFEAQNFIKLLNKGETKLSIENYNKVVAIRNWIKYELKIEDTINMPKVESIHKFSLNEEDNYMQEFKEEVKKSIADGFIQDYEFEGFTIDFANPETKEAIFLENENHFIRCGNKAVPLGNMILADRVLRILGWKIEVLSVYNYLYSSSPFLNRIRSITLNSL